MQLDYSKLGPLSRRLLNYKPQDKKKISKELEKKPRILRVLCQRPFYTGSGINLINLTKLSRAANLDQFILFGQPAGEPNPLRGIIPDENTSIVNFQNYNSPLVPDISFPVAGMSDQMPYKSTKFSDFNEEMLEMYLEAFAKKLTLTVEQFHPNIIHSHHLWLVSSLCRVLFPDIPIISSCHNTALRQLVLSEHLKDFVVNPIKNLNAITVLHENQKRRVTDLYGFNKSDEAIKNILVIGTSINTEIFYPPKKIEKGNEENFKKLIYVGKLSNAKGVPELIKAFKQLESEKSSNTELNIIGSGEGIEKDSITRMTKHLNNKINLHGQLNQDDLADKFRESDLFILPSYYEGFPTVLIESLACGCKAIVTDLPGIKEKLTTCCGESNNIQYIPLPKMKTIDQPEESDIPVFVNTLKESIIAQLKNVKQNQKDYKYSERIIEEFGWNALFKKYLIIYNSLL